MKSMKPILFLLILLIIPIALAVTFDVYPHGDYPPGHNLSWGGYDGYFRYVVTGIPPPGIAVYFNCSLTFYDWELYQIYTFNEILGVNGADTGFTVDNYLSQVHNNSNPPGYSFFHAYLSRNYTEEITVEVHCINTNDGYNFTKFDTFNLVNIALFSINISDAVYGSNTYFSVNFSGYNYDMGRYFYINISFFNTYGMKVYSYLYYDWLGIGRGTTQGLESSYIHTFLIANSSGDINWSSLPNINGTYNVIITAETITAYEYVTYLQVYKGAPLFIGNIVPWNLNGIIAGNLCFDNIVNQDEIEIDYGGICGSCGTNYSKANDVIWQLWRATYPVGGFDVYSCNTGEGAGGLMIIIIILTVLALFFLMLLWFAFGFGFLLVMIRTFYKLLKRNAQKEKR